MSNVYDQAVLDWANDQLRQRDLPEDAISLTFGYELGCYSSWTCDYDVTATIHRADGSTFETSAGWTKLLTDLPEYVEAAEAMHEAHDASHKRDDE